MTQLNEEFLDKIYSLISEIPAGKVSTYGDIAKACGYDKNARLVGKALKYSDLFGDLPCHRVVNSIGRLTPGWREQKDLLLNEKVPFKKNGTVDLKKCLWEW